MKGLIILDKNDNKKKHVEVKKELLLSDTSDFRTNMMRRTQLLRCSISITYSVVNPLFVLADVGKHSKLKITE